jgi:Nif-specific regulatory protein
MAPTDEIVGTPRRTPRASTVENDPRGATKEIRRLSSLIEISQALAATLNLTVALPQALEILERHHRVVRTAITLLDEESGELYIKASTGLTPEGQRARYRLGEGITGRVVESGKPIVVPEASREPLLLNRAARRQDRQEFTFICVPLVISKKVVGALSVDLLFRRDRDYDRSLKFYKLVASMMAQAVKVSRMAEAERRRLVEENTHLKDELRDRFAFQHLIGTSAPIRQVYDQVGQVAKTNTTVLVRGESGHGQGDDRARDPLQLGPRAKTVHQGELRGAARVAHRVGAVRLRARRLHGRAGPEEGPVRAGRWRHAVPG